MLGGHFLQQRLNFLLAVILFAASVAAPYRTPNGRVLLLQGRIGQVDHSTACVRVQSVSGMIQGMRVVATCVDALPRSDSTHSCKVFRQLPTSSTVRSLHPSIHPVLLPVLTPLRC